MISCDFVTAESVNVLTNIVEAGGANNLGFNMLEPEYLTGNVSKRMFWNKILVFFNQKSFLYHQMLFFGLKLIIVQHQTSLQAI